MNNDDGSAAIEASLAVTALMLVMFFLIGAIRIVGAGGDVHSAAWAAARAASTAYNPDQAAAHAKDVAASTLKDRGVSCRNLTVKVGGDLTPGGVITVDVTCTVALADIGLVGFPGTRTATGRGVEQIDLLRGGTP